MQTQAIQDYLETWNLTQSSIRESPMVANWQYGTEEAITDAKRIKEYRSQIGSLNYFHSCTRPEIGFAVSNLCRFLNKPNEACFRALKHLNCYMAHTPHLGLVYHSTNTTKLRLEHYVTEFNLPNGSIKTPTLLAYSDSSYGGADVDKAKSTSGSLFYLSGALIDWKSGLQSTIAQSSAEAEGNAAFDTARTCIYLRQFLEELGMKQHGPTIIKEDNTAAIARSKNAGVHSRKTRHILLKYHYMTEIADQEQCQLEYVKTQDQVADILTKALNIPTFTHLRPFLVRSSPMLSSFNPD
jgi:hypothetical protein